MRQQQELIAKAGSAVNEIRDEFVDTVADDIQAFKAANPQAQFEDFVRWHSPRDWSEKEGEVMGELSIRMQGQNPLRTLFDELKGVPAKQQKQFFNPDFESELVLDYLRTLSPLSALQNLISPFLEATVYIFDHVDEAILKIDCFNSKLNEYKAVVKRTSRVLDSTGDVSEELFCECSRLLADLEITTAKLSSLLEITQGDWEVVNALANEQFALDLVDDLKEHREVFVQLIQSYLERGEAESSLYKLYAESHRSSEENGLAERVPSSGHRL